MNMSLKNITQYVDSEGTRALYNSLINYSKDNSAAYNFTKNITAREHAVKEFFDILGIDPYKVQELYVESIDASRQTILYWGLYPLRLRNESEILRFIRRRNEDDSFVEMIHTSFGFAFF